MTPEEYACLTGHTEKYVRNWFATETLKNDPDVQIEMHIAVSEIINHCDKLIVMNSLERKPANGKRGNRAL